MWTRFVNMYPVPGRPEPILYAYVEAPMKKAKEILKQEMTSMGLEPSGLFAIDEHLSLDQASGYERGCPCLFNPVKHTWRWTEPGIKYTRNLIFHAGYGRYEDMKDFRMRQDVLVYERFA